MDPSQLDAFLDEQFPTRSEMLYVNHAAISPWSRAATDAAIDFARENSERGPMAVSKWLLREGRLRRTIAGFLNAGEDDIALVQNTSEGINIIASGIGWKSGDNIILPAGEYVSNRLPWLALRRLGVETREIDIRSSNDPEQALADAIDERTRVLTVSGVQWSDGFRLDLERLGAACADSNALFFVDAIQQFCALQIDVTACRIDALAAGSHKWQMGPEGMGVFYCSAEARDKISVNRHGWRMLEHPFQFDREDHQPAHTARRFEAGSPNTLGQAALSGALSVFEKLGLPESERRILANSRDLTKGLADIRGVELVSATDPRRMSGIVAFKAAGTESAQLRSRLSRRGVFTAVRENAVRLSPHFYQGSAQIDELLVRIEECI